jgi:hypothetical protein
MAYHTPDLPLAARAEVSLFNGSRKDVEPISRAMNSPFSDFAQRVFSFLEDAGFRLSERSAERLRYETAQVFLMVDRDPRDGALDVYIGLQPKKGEPRDDFSLTTLLAMEAADVPEARMPFQVFDQSKIGPFLERLAHDTKTYAQPALAGDRMFFHRLRAFRSAQSKAYELQRVRAQANRAWQSRDLDKLIVLYTSIEDQLTASERAKLGYARRHTSPSGHLR